MFMRPKGDDFEALVLLNPHASRLSVSVCSGPIGWSRVILRTHSIEEGHKQVLTSQVSNYWTRCQETISWVLKATDQ